MAIPREKFTSIKSEVIELVSVLFESFNPELDVESQLEAHKAALGEYINHVAHIGMAAGSQGYKGVRDICVAFQEYLRELHQQQRVLNSDEREFLEEWPMLMMAYLSDTRTESASDDLIEHLQKVLPADRISPSDYLEMKEQLYTDGLKLDDAEAEPNPITDEEPVSIVSLDKESGEPEKTHESDILEDASITADTAQQEELGSAADPDILTAVGEEIGDAVSELLITFKEIKRDSQSVTEMAAALDLCADRLEIVGMSIAGVGLMGVMDVVMLCQEGLRELAQNGDVEQFESVTLLSDWADALMNYLSEPNNPDLSINLISVSQQLPWLNTMNDTEADTLLSMLMPEEIELDGPGYEFDDGNDIQHAQETTAEDISTAVSQSDDSNSEPAVASTAGASAGILQPDTAPSMDWADDFATESPSLPQEIIFESLDKPPVTLNESIQELISLLRSEMEAAQETINSLLARAIESDQAEDRTSSLQDYAEEVERFALASDSLGLKGLANLLEVLTSNLQEYIDRHDFNAEQGLLLAEWPGHFLAYLEDLNNPEVVQSLIRYMANPEWPLPLNQEIADQLQYQLLSPEIELDEEEEPRQKQASVEDVSLQLPEDVNQDLLGSLLRELPGYTAEFTEAVTRLTEGAGTQQDVDVAQRVAHTLKGAANTVGVIGIASLTHHIEDILLAFSKHDALPGAGLSDSLMQAADTLEAMSESLLGMGPAPDDAVTVLQQILDWANYIDENGIPEDDEQITPKTAAPNASAEETASQVMEVEPDEQAGDAFLRVPAKLVDELLRVVGESVILNGQLSEQLRKALQQTRSAQEQNKLLQQLTFDLEQLVDIQGLTWSQHRIQVNDAFDSLEMDQYNELHTVTRRLVEAATDSQEFAQNIEEQLIHLDDLVIEQGRLHKTNQETVMQTRMVPVQNIVPRLQRGVRQASRLTDKKVKLVVSGSDTLMDSDVLNNLIDPLMHILRNAIDHGIEPEGVRLGRNKALEGQISLSFLREGDQMLVRCRDDGAGLDYAAIRQTAIERELITADQDVSNEELRRFILQQGFSTRTRTTQISGRGIGMDAVYNRIISLKGSLSIESEPGHGTLVELRLPITFISVHGLLIRSRNRKLALSNRGVEQIFYAGAGILHTEDGVTTYRIDEEVYQAVHIDHLLHLKADRRKSVRDDCPVLLVREDTGDLRAVIVEEVIASQDLVVKALGKYLPEIEGIEGATILGDGSVATVVDLPDLLRADTRRLRIESGDLDEEIDLETSLPCALVVDDSLTARRTMAEFIQDMGYEVRTARDGLEAIDIIEGKQPDIVLVDLEMPRMNGLELTNHIRAKQETRDIPIIMVTSRSTEKHRQQAEASGVNLYLTKPFSEDELMQHIERLHSEAVSA
jgi:chemosensory pili system protein ChpA (sensor histidine kinase/response regulator)